VQATPPRLNLRLTRAPLAFFYPTFLTPGIFHEPFRMSGRSFWANTTASSKRNRALATPASSISSKLRNQPNDGKKNGSQNKSGFIFFFRLITFNFRYLGRIQPFQNSFHVWSFELSGESTCQVPDQLVVRKDSREDRGVVRQADGCAVRERSAVETVA
jgi:hypothetical protein